MTRDEYEAKYRGDPVIHTCPQAPYCLNCYIAWARMEAWNLAGPYGTKGWGLREFDHGSYRKVKR